MVLAGSSAIARSDTHQSQLFADASAEKGIRTCTYRIYYIQIFYSVMPYCDHIVALIANTPQGEEVKFAEPNPFHEAGTGPQVAVGYR